MPRVGIVIIGRNEGDRFRQCLDTVASANCSTTYVDSGSTDDSPALARSRGVDVVELDLTVPFTAARARNAGFERLVQIAPNIEFVQFIDGDCEMASGWLDAATRTLDDRPEAVVVCGRRREKFPNATVYNRLCDLEWDTPIGPALACGGDALFRVDAFRKAGGYRAELIAGEEPELCVRLRANDGQILRIDAEMTRHDAAMTRFGQWWKRNVRAGHAYAEVARLHASSSFGIWAKEVRSNWIWGLVVPASIVLLPAWLILYGKIVRYRRSLGDDARTARLFARYCVLGKVPQMFGQLAFWRNRIFGRTGRLIEYKAGG